VQSDAELVNAVLSGEREAFAELVKRYERPVRAVAMNVLGDYHRAQDSAQDAFVQAYKKLPHLRKAEAFGPWMMKITRRCALDLISRRPKETSLEPVAAVVGNPDGQLDEDKRMLLAAAADLRGGEKQVVMLRYFCGHSVKDVAEIVGRSVGTVTKQLSRARIRLRNILEKSEK